METTAMTELVHRLKSLQDNGHDDAGIRTAMQIGIKLIETEKKQIVDAWLDGGKMVSESKNAEQYFTNTFKQ